MNMLGVLLIHMLPPYFRKLVWRLMGHEIGVGVKVSYFSIIRSKSIALHDGARIDPLVVINTRKVTLKKRARIKSLSVIDTPEFELGEDSTILQQVVVGGMVTPRSKLIIGKRVKVFSFSFLNPTEPIIIDDDVGIGGANYIFTHGSWQSVLDGFPASFGPVHIEKGVWFPWRVFVMPNVTVGEYATIGANSVITRHIPKRSLAVGSPAKVLKTGDEYIRPMSESQRKNFVAKTLEEFVEYLSFMGHLAVKETAEPAWTIRVKGKKKVQLRFLDGFQGDISGDVDCVIVSMSYPIQLPKRTVAVFAVDEKKLYVDDLRQVAELRDFFSRYGVRFEVLPL